MASAGFSDQWERVIDPPLFRTEAPPVMPLIDVHVNALPPKTTGESGFYLQQTMEQHAAALSAKTVVGPPRVSDYFAANSAIRIAASKAERWLAMARFAGTLWPFGRPWALKRQIGAIFASRPVEEQIDFDGISAIKLMPFADGLPSGSLLEQIVDSKLPVLVHAGEKCPPEWVASKLLKRLDAPLIFAHLGSWPCSADALESAVALARSDERVYLETSGAWIGNFITFAVKQVPDKVMFGSNSPMCPVAVQWAHVASAVCSDTHLEAVAHANAARIFNQKLD